MDVSKLTRGKAVKVVALVSDPKLLATLATHKNKHVKHAALYKSDEAYRAQYVAAREAKGAAS